jgi:nicotinate phosphoribosyltransferase
VAKVTMPGRKDAYRLFSESGHALVDLLQRSTEPPPEINEKVLCRHPFIESKRAYVIPSRVEKLLTVYWKDGAMCQELPNLQEIKERVQASLKTLRSDIKRNLNPTPFKVCLFTKLE